MMNYLLTIGLLVVSNIFMTLAWYGHLKLAEFSWFSKLPLMGIIVISWLIAFFEYCFQVPANRIGFQGNGGSFSLLQLKVIQEVITLMVFVIFSSVAFQTQIRLNHLVGFLFLVLAVYFIFKP
ncbi:MAG: DMT family protein [Proteiniphilum sp.]